MHSILSIFLIVMTALGGWFGFADKIPVNPTRITFESTDMAKNADISVSTNTAFKPWLTDASALTYWMTGEDNGQYIELNFGKETQLNSIAIRELANTDNVKLFKIFAMTENGYEEIYRQDRIMTYRLCTFDTVSTEKIKIEFTEIAGSVKIGGIEVYNEDRTGSELRSSAYITFNEYTQDTLSRPGFSDYFDTVTDAIIFQNVSLDKDGNLIIAEGEEKFAENMKLLHDVIGDRDVTLWCSVLFQLGTDDPKYTDMNDYRADFLDSHKDIIMTNLKNFTEKFGIDGIDYDWEHPTTDSQFAAYDRLILATAEFTKVSIASVTWEFRFSDAAIEAVDHFNVMTYDMFDTRGDHSNIYECGREAIELMIGYGVPKEKIFLGIPFYARPENHGLQWPPYSICPGADKYSNYSPDYNYYQDGELQTAGLYYNSYTEVRDKTALSIQYGLGGVMIYNLNSDMPYSSDISLTRAIHDAQTK